MILNLKIFELEFEIQNMVIKETFLLPTLLKTQLKHEYLQHSQGCV